MIAALIAAATNLAATADAERLVARLGLQSDTESVRAIGRYRCRAVPALVRQLEVVRPFRIRGYEGDRYPQAIRIVWTLAALRHITDTDFHAPRTWWFNPDSPGARMMSMGAPPNSTKFFGIWPSRGSTYFAPPAQQRAIIEQWRRYSLSGACRDAEPNPDYTFWLYGDRFNATRARLSVGAMRAGPHGSTAGDGARRRREG